MCHTEKLHKPNANFSHEFPSSSFILLVILELISLQLFQRTCYYYWTVELQHSQVHKESLSLLQVIQIISTLKKLQSEKCHHIVSPKALPAINFVLSYLPYYVICLICMQAEKTNKKWRKNKRQEKECSPAVCTVLFMKALPGTMETNYLLTMWNRILFTRLRFLLLFQMRFFTASSFVSRSIIVSIFQNQSVSKKKWTGKKKEKEKWIAVLHKTSH